MKSMLIDMFFECSVACTPIHITISTLLNNKYFVSIFAVIISLTFSVCVCVGGCGCVTALVAVTLLYMVPIGSVLMFGCGL